MNRRFAEVASSVASLGATVWVHDYQLQLVPTMLRELRPDLSIGFFLHIPFPPRELFLQLPWRRELIAGLLGADLIGFQMPSAASNFSRLTRLLGRDSRHQPSRRVRRSHGSRWRLPDLGRLRRPRRARVDPGVRARALEIRANLGNPKHVLLGVDRLDYTKGIDQRIRAVARAVRRRHVDRRRRRDDPGRGSDPEEDTHYQDERRQLEQVVSEANGEHALVGQPVIHYLHQSVSLNELVAMYLAADLMVVTPFRDGMNLVAKEFVACRTDNSGGLILSEFAGAAAELRGAYLVNPHDVEGVKEGIRRALSEGQRTSHARMVRMRRAVLRNDVHAWARSFLETLEHAKRRTAPALIDDSVFKDRAAREL